MSRTLPAQLSGTATKPCPELSEVRDLLRAHHPHESDPTNPRYPPRPAGVLIECDPAVKSIIVNIDSANHEYIIEDLDEQRCVVKETMVADLKQKLDEVRGGTTASD